MYGTVATMRIKQGEEQKLTELLERWWRERAPKVQGAVSTTIYRLEVDPLEYVMAVVFDSKENYRANANNPEQDRWYQELRACLDAEPIWDDGEVVAHHQQG